MLAEAIDASGPSLALHGHAHNGVENGAGPRGVPVRNVARTVLGKPYAVYELD